MVVLVPTYVLPAKPNHLEPETFQSSSDKEENKETEEAPVKTEIPSKATVRLSETSAVEPTGNATNCLQDIREIPPTAEIVSNSATLRESGNPMKLSSTAASSESTWDRSENRQQLITDVALENVDECAKQNEQQRIRSWSIFGSRISAVVDANKDVNSKHHSFRQFNGTDENFATTTAMVQRSNAVNILWNALRRSFQQSSVWQAVTTTNKHPDDAEKTRAGPVELLMHAIQRPFRKRSEQRSDDPEKSETVETRSAIKAGRWGFFRRMLPSQNAIEQSPSRAIVSFDANTHPVAIAMKKAAVGIGGASMVVVGVPLLLFPVPGPGVAMIASGVYVISTEFQCARNWLDGIKSRYGNILDRIGIEIAEVEQMPRSRMEGQPSHGPSPAMALPESSGPADADDLRTLSAENETSDLDAMKPETAEESKTEKSSETEPLATQK